MVSLTAVDLVIAAWFILASLVAIFMVRRGHSPAKWTAIAFLTGPLAVPLAAWSRYRSRGIRPTTLQWGERGPGSLSVLVGIDGSAAAHAALHGVAQLLDDRIGRLTLAYVLDYDAAAGKEEAQPRAAAADTLAEAARTVEELLGVRPTSIVLAGSPAQALMEHALAAAHDLVVIGTHGRGDADWLHGSVASALAQEPPIRVMILTAATAARPGLIDESAELDAPLGQPE